MVTASTWGRQGHFRNERWVKLLIDTLYRYRGSAYLLHEFVIMPDHLHVLITPLGKAAFDELHSFLQAPFLPHFHVGAEFFLCSIGFQAVGAPKGAPFQSTSVESRHAVGSAPVKNDKNKIA
jgi:REP element-mobilizing transposase RayT